MVFSFHLFFTKQKIEEDWAKISEDGKNLIRKMLTFNPADRISAREALNDKWIQANAISAPISQKALKNLSDFSVKLLKNIFMNKKNRQEINLNKQFLHLS